MNKKRSVARFPEHGNGPLEPGDISNKFSDTENRGGEPELDRSDKRPAEERATSAQYPGVKSRKAKKREK